MKPRGGGGPSWNPLPGPCGTSWPWRSSKWRETLASVRVGRPPQLFAQWVGASEASRHRPSQPGNQALTRDPLCAPTQALLRDLCSGARRGGRECPRAPVAGAACPWAGDPFPALPMGGGGPRPHTHTRPPRQALRSPAVQEPGQGRAPHPHWAPAAGRHSADTRASPGICPQLPMSRSGRAGLWGRARSQLDWWSVRTMCFMVVCGPGQLQGDPGGGWAPCQPGDPG